MSQYQRQYSTLPPVLYGIGILRVNPNWVELYPTRTRLEQPWGPFGQDHEIQAVDIGIIIV